ncbi:hypothetical protein ABZ753_31075, partial [Streptomyces griseoincarnatus]
LLSTPSRCVMATTDDACCGKPAGAICVHDVTTPGQRITREQLDALRNANLPAGTVITSDVVNEATRQATPREHCGNLSPDTGLTTVRTECVLPPGHQGSHADDVGARWWYDPTSDAAGNHTAPSRVVHSTSNTPPTENT